MNKARILEIEKALNETVLKNVAKTEKGYIGRDKNGKIIFVDDPQTSATLSKTFLNKIKDFNYQIEKAAFPALSLFERGLLEDELKALKAGHSSVSEMREAEKKLKDEEFNSKKEICENSIFKKLIGDHFCAVANPYFYFNIEKIINAIKDEAIRQGAEVYHTSTKGAKKTSFYLKKNGIKIRISDHELPQIMHRRKMEYTSSWDKEVIVCNDRTIWPIVSIKTQSDFFVYVDRFFLEE
jgi:hypothetical protein